MFQLCIGNLIQLDIAEVKNHINCNLNEVQEIEKPRQEKNKASATVCKLNKVFGNTKMYPIQIKISNCNDFPLAVRDFQNL